MAGIEASPLIVLVGLSVLLLILHISLQGVLATRELGAKWNAGPRDGDRAVTGVLAGRAMRASANYQETFPAFAALALALAASGNPGDSGLAGAWIWLLARAVYLPLYLAGIPYLRSFVWLVAFVGLLLMCFTLLF